MPDELLGRVALRGAAHVTDRNSIVSGQRRNSAAEFPYFFGRAVAEMFQMPHLSIRDIFWIGRTQEIVSSLSGRRCSAHYRPP